MKIILAAINARYVHTNLAIRYLNKRLKGYFDVSVKEYTINHEVQVMLRELYLERADVVAFSCYIWNIEMVLKLVKSLKKIHPETQIILGGPEVVYDSKEMMKSCDAIDFIISGEGIEETFSLLDAMENNRDYTALQGLHYRVRGQVYSNPPAKRTKSALMELSAYDVDSHMEPDKIYYYETTRGCPFTCQFCLSGNESGLVSFPLEKTYRELQIFLDEKVKQVKLVDRTFNADAQRAMKIWTFLKEHDNGITNFHFEISARLLTDEMLAFLETVPVGLFQFEIGVQTTCKLSLQAIGRAQDQEWEFKVIRRLVRAKKIHIHVDLIAGLPHEDLLRFRRSFDEVFQLEADMVQLGFLKLLKGSGLRARILDYGYVHQEEPPYEILESHVMHYGEIIQLKQVEEVLERFWNLGHYRETIYFILNHSNKSPFSFFAELAKAWKLAGGWHRQIGQLEQLVILRDYLQHNFAYHKHLIDAALRYDCARMNYQGKLPVDLLETVTPEKKEKLHVLLHNNNFRKTFFPEMQEIPTKKHLPFVRLFSLPSSIMIEHGHLKDRSSDASGMTEEKDDWLMIYPRDKKCRNQHVTVVNLAKALNHYKEII